MARSNNQQSLALSDSASAEAAGKRAALWKKSASNWRARFVAEKPLRDRLVVMLRAANAEIESLKSRLPDW
jgi:hypothetical protein